MIVADSNLVAYLLIPGEKSALADRILLKDSVWIVPLICRSEMRNILTLYIRHEGMTLAQARSTMRKAEALLRNREYAVPSDTILELTSRHAVTAYDGEYVVLAKQLGVTLITFDRPIRRAFPDIAVDPKAFADG